MSRNRHNVTTTRASPTEARVLDWVRSHAPYVIDYEQLRTELRFKPAYARKIMQRMTHKGLIRPIYRGVFELTEKPLIPQIQEAERHILSTVGDSDRSVASVLDRPITHDVFCVLSLDTQALGPITESMNFAKNESW